MIHLLMGYSCGELGRYPFVSQHLGQIECDLRTCLSFEKRQMCEKAEDLSAKKNKLCEK